MDSDLHKMTSEFHRLMELSDQVKSASPDSHDVIDKTVEAIKSKIQSLNEEKKRKAVELEKIKTQWCVVSLAQSTLAEIINTCT